MVDEYSWKISYSELSHTLPSVTEPDQAYTIAELLERHRQGILTDTEIHKDGYFNEHADFDSPDFEKFSDSDLTEKADYFTARRSEMEEIRKASEEKEAARKKAEEAEFEEFKKSRVKPPEDSGVPGDKPGV